MARPGAAWRDRVAAEGLTVPGARPCLEEGDSGAPLVRPALERRREGVAARAVERLAGHAPERLARQDACHVLLVDALRRAGGEGIVLTRALGPRPADARLLQVQGMRAEYARATSLERQRRGQRQAARSGGVHGLRGAPSGSRSVTQEAGGGQAR